MTLFQRFITSAGLFIGATLQAATPLSHIVPEQAALIVSVQDAPALLSQWEKSPWAKTWNDEQMKKFFAPLRADWKIDEWDTMAKEKTGYTVSELLAFATGEAVIVVSDFDFATEDDSATPPILIALDVGENAGKVEALLLKSSKESGDTVETSDFGGVTVYVVQPKPKEEASEADGDEEDAMAAAEEEGIEGDEDAAPKAETPTAWAVVDGKWLISPSKETVFGAIDAVKNGGVDSPWGRSERYARLQQRVGDSHVTFLLNAETIFPAMQKAIEVRQQAQTEAGAPGAFDGVALLKALGLDAWREVYATFAIRDDATQAHFGVTYSEPRGLLKLAAYKEGPLDLPRFASPKWLTVSTDKFSLKEAYAAIEEILEAFNPAISGLVQGQVKSLNQQLGVDLKRDLIGSLGESIVTATTLSPSATAGAQPGAEDLEQLFAIALENPAAFTGALDAIKRSMGPQGDSLFQTRDYLGEKIVTIVQPSAPGAAPSKGVSYSVAKGYLFLGIGSAAPVESALQGLANDRPTLWEQEDVRAALAQVPANASVFQYQDIKAIVASGFKSLSAAASLMGQSSGGPQPIPESADGSEDAGPMLVQEENKLPFDPNYQPDAASIAKYWSYAWGYAVRDSSGLHATSQIVHPK